MTIITLNLTEKPISLDQLSKEFIDISVEEGNILLEVDDGLNLTEEQIIILQSIVDDHTSIPKNSIIIETSEFLSKLSVEQIIAVSTHSGMRSVLDILSIRKTDLLLNSELAMKLMNYMLLQNLINQITKDAIQLMLEGKGLVFPE